MSFDAVDLPNLQEDPGDDFWVISFGFDELAPDVSEAAYGDDVEVRVTSDEGAVAAVAIALEVAVEGGFSFSIDEDVVETGVCPAFVPVKQDAVFGMVVGPEVALAGFPGAGFEAADRCLVSFDIRTLPELIGDESPLVSIPAGRRVGGSRTFR